MTTKVLICLSICLSMAACADKEEDSDTTEVSCSGDGIDGEALYATHCLSCHTLDGSQGVGPDLANMMGHHDDEFILETINDGWEEMPAFEGTLSCDEQHAVLDYLRDTHGEFTGEGH